LRPASQRVHTQILQIHGVDEHPKSMLPRAHAHEAAWGLPSNSPTFDLFVEKTNEN
jgi:hypothetical protein